MADIATVLKKTIDGLPTNNPDIRKKVYAKARASILARLEAKDPKPEQAAIDKQMAGVDRIIAAVESEYAFTDQVDDVLGGDLGETPSAEKTPPAAAPASPSTPAPATSAVPPPPPPPPAEPAVDPAAPDFGGETAAASEAPQPGPVPDAGSAGPAPAPQPRRSSGPALRVLAWAVAIVLVIGAGGYAAWTNQDYLRAQLAKLTATSGEGSTPATPAATEKAADSKPAAETAGDSGSMSADEAAAKSENGKFTQRLLADGSEVDPGAAADKPTVGEGTSVAQATQPSQSDDGSDKMANGGEDAGPAATDQSAGDQNEASTDQEKAVPVGQRAIFYEERTSSAQETADQGNVVWSKVEESPGDGAPREPAIRADVSIPDKDLTLRMTIRRNADKTLPASHIIELVFVTPEGFTGGAVDDVLRVAFKDTEQSAGNPLLGLPVKIDDGLFLYALTDSAADIETNTTLMRRQSWIDVTILYRTGRRALITMEKGIPGSNVFDEVLKSWSTSTVTGG